VNADHEAQQDALSYGEITHRWPSMTNEAHSIG